jgi:hypothetical protein
LSDERIRLLNSFRNSGFSVDDSPTLWPEDSDGLERLARCLLRCPLSLSRIHWTKGARTLFYEGKSSHDDPLASDPQGSILNLVSGTLCGLAPLLGWARGRKEPVGRLEFPARSRSSGRGGWFSIWGQWGKPQV